MSRAVDRFVLSRASAVCSLSSTRTVRVVEFEAATTMSISTLQRHRATALLPLVFTLALLAAAPARAADQVYFSAVDNIAARLVERINAETVRIDMSAWYLTDSSVYNALLAAHRRGHDRGVQGRAEDGDPGVRRRRVAGQEVGLDGEVVEGLAVLVERPFVGVAAGQESVGAGAERLLHLGGEVLDGHELQGLVGAGDRGASLGKGLAGGERVQRHAVARGNGIAQRLLARFGHQGFDFPALADPEAGRFVELDPQGPHERSGAVAS